MKDHRKERAEARKKAEKLVSQMTLLEKASQLKYDAAPVKRLGVPAYNYWNEALHGVARAGVATMFPQAIAMAAVFDDEEMKKVGDIIATEGRAKYNAYSAKEDRDIYKGLTFWSPNVNIFRDPRWGRGHETYGEDPYLTSRLGVKFVEGIQGDGPVMKAAACAKHYAVHSGPESLRHEFDAQASMKDMWETYLPAFEALVTEADVEAVMGAYNRTNGEPCCAHKYLMEDVLRGKWKFEGHYTSDCWAIRDFHEHHMVTSTPRQSAAMALNAGCDLNCGNTYLHMMGAYQDGLVTEEKITESAVRLLTTRYLLGLFDGSEYDKIPYSVVECKEHIDEALKMARKSCVLLKNDGALPIDKTKVNTIGVIGPNADSRAALIGNYHGTSSEYITVLEGIREEAGDDVRILYSQGCDLYKDKVENLAWDQDRISEAVITAENSDVVILCVGLDETLEGEEGDTGNSYASGDKETLQLPQVQLDLMEAMAESGKPVVLCLMAGSDIDLSYAEDKLFNMQCYICDAKYAFLEDIGYIYRKNDMSVSWQYRPDSVENWFKLVCELKSWIEKKDKDPKEYTSLIGYLLIFAAFFDGKMEYMQHKKSLWAVRKVLKKYGSNPMGRKAFTELADRRKKLQITQKLWKIMIRTFSLGMKWRWYLLMSVGIKILVSCRVDERLSDTGIRKK